MKEITFFMTSEKQLRILTPRVQIFNQDNNAFAIKLNVAGEWEGLSKWIRIRFELAPNGAVNVVTLPLTDPFFLSNGYTQGNFVEFSFALYNGDTPPISAFTEWIRIGIIPNTVDDGTIEPEEVPNIWQVLSDLTDRISDLEMGGAGGGGTTVHNELTGRSVNDCHPISAITSLDTKLNQLPDNIGRRGALKTVTYSSNNQTFDLSFPMGVNIFISNLSLVSSATYSLTNDTVPSNWIYEWEIHIIQGATPATITWFPNITWLEGSAPAQEANTTKKYLFRKYPDGKIEGYNRNVIEFVNNSIGGAINATY